MGSLLIVGILLIILAGLALLYIQQKGRGDELRGQITQMQVTLSRPLSSAAELKADFAAVNSALAPLTDTQIIDIIISIAEASGIDVDPESGKLVIPPQSEVRGKKLAESTYQVMSFKNITVRGDYEDILTFISKLESGEALETLVITGVTIGQYQEEEADTLATLDVDIYSKGGGG